MTARRRSYSCYIGGRNISNARYADDTALIAQSPLEIQQLLDKSNAAGAQILPKLNVKKTKRMTIGDVPDDITIRVNKDPVEKVKQFKHWYGRFVLRSRSLDYEGARRT